jgi:hypothetical protein
MVNGPAALFRSVKAVDTNDLKVLFTFYGGGRIA